MTEQEFLKMAQARFGDIARRSDLKKFCKQEKIKIPTWLQKCDPSRKVGRGLYMLKDKVSKQMNVKSDKSLVPKVDKLFVKCKNFNHLKKVIKSEKFYPVFISGLSGNGKTLLVHQVCASLKRELFRVNITTESDEDDLFSDLIHELAHAYIRKHYDQVFGDGRLEKEFITKRNKLYHKMRSSGIDLPPHQFFENPNFDRKFDGYLNRTIGYDLLSQLISGIFPSCYSVSSLEEYFSVGLELLFTGKGRVIKDCPVLEEKVSI